MTISAELLDEIRYNKDVMVEDRIVRHSRWSVHHVLVFKYEGKFYRTEYSRPATECQEEYEPDTYECVEVVPVERMVTVYE